MARVTGAKDEGEEGPPAVGLSESGKSRGGGRETSMSAHIRLSKHGGLDRGNGGRGLKEEGKWNDEISPPGGRSGFLPAS